MSPTPFLRFASVTLALSLGVLAACSSGSSGSDHLCNVACVVEPALLAAPKAVATATSSTTTTCDAAPECGDAGDCTTVRVGLFGAGQCKIAVTYVDGTSFTFVSNVSEDTASCCPSYSLDSTTLGT